jgi:4-hydroxybenzoate polyprenyltransferase
MKSRLSILRHVVISMRPKQWTKNGFVFAGLIFSKSFLEPALVLRTVCAFVLFSLVSGSIYIINDLLDRERDLLHPHKCKRPIASGKLKPSTALMFSVVILSISFVISFTFDLKFSMILAAYFLLVLVYSLKLKNVVILDVILIAVGFVLRTIGGAAVIKVWISPWLILCTTLLAMFLALNKRKNELLVLSEGAANHRKILGEYTPELLDMMLSVTTPATVMSYCLYTFSAGKTSYFMLTIPFVLYGIFRYQYLVSVRDMGGNPELVILRDRPLLLDLVLWVTACMAILLLFG